MRYKITEDVINKVREYNDIVDVIRGYIDLKKSGANYKGLCPFHNEKTPSFIVNENKQIFHCFGCGAGGDAIGFVMKYENVSFIEAVVILAQRAHIPLEYENEATRRKETEKDALYRIMERAKDYFKKNMSAAAREYLSGRGISEDVIESFELGYSPEKWTGLLDAARREDITIEQLEKCGLIIVNDNKMYDRFRGKIMFPIFDYMSRVIAFGGRVLDNSEPKYLNSPDTLLFNKSRTLFGLQVAKEHIASSDKAVIVEGYLDVISCHSAGIKNVVGVLGTAFNQEHIKLLNRYTKNLVFMFDSDSAGQEATNRAFNIALHYRTPPGVYAVDLTGAKDPDEFIKQQGAAELILRINAAKNFISFKTDYLNKKYDTNTTEGKQSAVEDFISDLKDATISELVKEEYLKKIALEYNISEFALREDYLNTKKIKKRVEKNDNRVHTKKYSSSDLAVFDVLSNSDDINQVDKLILDLSDDFFEQQELTEAYHKMKAIYEDKGLMALRNEAATFYSEYPDIFINITEKHISSDYFAKVMKLIRGRQLNKELGRLKRSIQEAEKKQDERALTDLLTQYQELTRLLKVEGG